jgi:twitching motility protein PilT
MSKQPSVSLLGRLAVHFKMISMEQLAVATRELGADTSSRRLGDIFVDKGFITQVQLAKLVRAQQEVVAKQRAAGAAPERTAASAPEPRAATAPERAPAAATVNAPAPARAGAGAKRAPLAAPATGTPELDRILRDAIAQGASDIHVHSGSALQYRIAGKLVTTGSAPLDAAGAEGVLLPALTEQERSVFAEHGDLDFCHEVPGAGRFRVNLYRQQRGIDAVLRFILPEPPSLEQLGLPSGLARFITYPQGLVLITGPTGCGKTSTLAALVDLINEERREHILTIEDPVEYLHPSKRCLVNQRSVHRHTGSFARALRAALREDPDVIVIGELRDLETISLALTAAETGHLVLATLHTDNAIRTINRIVGSYPSDHQSQIRSMLSESLRAVVSQRLIPRADGKGRVAAVETLVVNKAVANLIRENKTFQIQSILQTGAAQGMGLLDASIRQHVQSGAIGREEALRYCAEPKNLSA